MALLKIKSKVQNTKVATFEKGADPEEKLMLIADENVKKYRISTKFCRFLAKTRINRGLSLTVNDPMSVHSLISAPL